MKASKHLAVVGWTILLLATTILCILNVPNLIFSPNRSKATFTFDEELVGSALHEVGRPRVAVCRAPLKEITIQQKRSLVSRLVTLKIESENRPQECNKLVFFADSPPLEDSGAGEASLANGICPVAWRENSDIRLASKYVVEVDVARKFKSQYTDAMLECVPSITFSLPAESTGFARQVLSMTLYMGARSAGQPFPAVTRVDKGEELSLSKSSIELHNRIELLDAALVSPRAASILEILNIVLSVIAGAGISILLEAWLGVHSGGS